MGTILRTRPIAAPAQRGNLVLSDEALAARLRDGDERAFEQLYARHHLPLRRYCASILRQPEDAEEAVQSAMMNAYLALAAGPPGDLAVRPWLYRIAHNQCVDVLRRRPQPAAAFTGEEAHDAPGVAERAEIADDIRWLRRDLLALPEDQRGALVMREMAGLSHQQIATALDDTPAGVKQLIYQARLALQSMASGRDLDCATVRDRIATGDGRVLRAKELKAHLRACATCEGASRAVRPDRSRLAALLPAGPAALLERVLSALRALGGGTTGGAGAGVLGAGGAAGLSTGAGVTLGAVTAAGLIAAAAIVAPASFRDTTPPAAERSAATRAASVVPTRPPASAIAFVSGSTVAMRPAGAPGLGAVPPAATAAADAAVDPAATPRATTPLLPAQDSAPGPISSEPAAAGAGSGVPAPRRRPVAPGPPRGARAASPVVPAARAPRPPVDPGSPAAPRRPAPGAGPVGRGAPPASGRPSDPPGRPAASGSAPATPAGSAPVAGPAPPPAPPGRPAPPAVPAAPAADVARPAAPAADVARPADPPGGLDGGSSPPTTVPPGSPGR